LGGMLTPQDALPKPGTAKEQTVDSIQDATTNTIAQKDKSNSYLRVERDKDGVPVAVQTATGRFVSASGEGNVVVDLVSVIHIADEAYYRVLNKQFQQYDVVLYELVAPKGTRIPKGGREQTDNPLAMIQEMASTVFGLVAQTDHIDYTQENLLHADMSFDEMAEAMAELGDDGITLMLGIAADLLRQANLQARRTANAPPTSVDEDFDPFSLLLDSEGPLKLKRMLAEQFAAMDDPATELGQTLNTILIKDRNAAAMRVFQQQLTAGKKRIAIFYGAGHMADFEQRLVRDFGLRREKMIWDTAWSLEDGSGEDPLLQILKLLKEIDR
ncbi:MAG: hypothetical protein MPJ50_18300, partial [Pirellulales bacterium]|nr:hypothetical protein [Pirellulales bacterium]